MYKTLILSMLLSASMATFFTSCASKSEKVEAAKENLQDAKEELNVAQKELNAEYPTFKIETEAKIAKNRLVINDIKATNSKTIDEARIKAINEIEKQNEMLVQKLNNYENEGSDWEAFKREFNHDMDGIGHALKDLGKDNKK